MKLKAIVEQLQYEGKVVQGEATKDVIYESHTIHPDELYKIKNLPIKSGTRLQ